MRRGSPRRARRRSRRGSPRACAGGVDRVVVARDRQRRRADAAELPAQVERGERLAAAPRSRPPAVERSIASNARRPSRSGRGAGVNQRSIPAGAIASMPSARTVARALVPALGRPELQRRCEQSTRRSTRSGASQREPHADHAAERQPAERHALDAEVVEQRRARRRRGRRPCTGRAGPASAPWPRVSKRSDAVAVGERRRLVVPHLRASCRASSRTSRRARPSGPSTTVMDARRSLRSSSARSMKATAAARSRLAAQVRRSRFARIRSGSTGQALERLVQRPRAAPPVPRERVASARRHSLCQAPAARSCSPAIAASSTPTRPRTDRAAARARIAPTGFCLCGIADEPPRPPPLASATSPTSVCASSTMSSATFSTAPAAIAERARRAPPTGRAVAVPGQRRLVEPELAREARRARRARASPSAASVPAAPPSCAGEPAARAAAPARRVDAGQPARGLEPERHRQRLLQQRPARHHACRGARAASARARRRPPRRARPASAPARASRRASPRVSSDVLAGRAAVDALAARRRPRAARCTSGTTGLPELAARRARARRRRSGRVARARRSRRPPRRGITPARGLARAPARPRRRASPAARPRRTTASARPPGTKIGVNRPLDVKEDGLALALEVDVEPVAVVLAGDQRLARRRVLDRRQHRVGGVGLRLVREVDPRDELLQQPAGETR